MLTIMLGVLVALLIGLRIGWRAGYENGRWDVYKRLPGNMQDEVDNEYLNESKWAPRRIIS